MENCSVKPHFLWGPHLGIGGHIEVAESLMLSLAISYSLYFDVWQGRSGTIDIKGHSKKFKDLKRFVGRNGMMQAEFVVGISYALPVRY